MTFKLIFEEWVEINDSKQQEVLGAMRAGRKASVFEMQTPAGSKGRNEGGKTNSSQSMENPEKMKSLSS